MRDWERWRLEEERLVLWARRQDRNRERVEGGRMERGHEEGAEWRCWR